MLNQRIQTQKTSQCVSQYGKQVGVGVAFSNTNELMSDRTLPFLNCGEDYETINNNQHSPNVSVFNIHQRSEFHYILIIT